MSVRELMFKIDGTGVFIILKDVAQTLLCLLCRGVGFEDRKYEILGDGVVDPLKDHRIQAAP